MESQPSSSPKRQHHRALIAAILALASGTAVYQTSSAPEAERQGHEEPNVVHRGEKSTPKDSRKHPNPQPPGESQHEFVPMDWPLNLPKELEAETGKGETVKMKIAGKEITLPKKTAEAIVEADKELKKETGEGLDINCPPPASQHGFGMAIDYEFLESEEMRKLMGKPVDINPIPDKEPRRDKEPNQRVIDQCEIKKPNKTDFLSS